MLLQKLRLKQNVSALGAGRLWSRGDCGELGQRLCKDSGHDVPRAALNGGYHSGLVCMEPLVFRKRQKSVFCKIPQLEIVK